MAAVVTHGDNVGVGPDDPPVLADVALFHAKLRDCAGAKLAAQGQVGFPVVGVEYSGCTAFENLFLAEAEKVPVALIGEDDLALLTQEGYADGRFLEEHAEAFLARFRRFLGSFARGDVQMGSAQPQWSPACVALGHPPPVENPDPFARLVPQPMLRFVKCALPRKVSVKKGMDFALVFGMHQLLPSLCTRCDLVRQIAQDLAAAGIRQQVAGRQMPVPSPQIGSVQGQFQPRLAVLQCRLRTGNGAAGQPDAQQPEKADETVGCCETGFAVRSGSQVRCQGNRNTDAAADIALFVSLGGVTFEAPLFSDHRPHEP